MRCNKCGIEFNGNFCPGCGTPAQPQMQQNQSQQVPPPVMPQQQNPYMQSQQPPKKKKRGCLITLLIVIGVFFIIGIIGSLFSSGDDAATPTSKTSDTTSVSDKAPSDNEEVEPTEKPIEYSAYDVSEMMENLNSNALKAEKKYQDQYVEITGRLSNIDSDGKYISLVPSDDEFAFMGVQCYIKTDEQTDKVMEMTKGDTVTIKGKITSIGEILGYSLDIDEIK